VEQTSTFGHWLKTRRKALDLTQAELAKRVGCATISIQLMETGKRRPSKQMAELIASQLNIPIEEHQDFIKFARAGTDDHARGMSDQADPAGLWSRFPHKPTHLPAQSTPLIGRDRDVTAAHKRLLHESTRLLTLIGPPGVGKTRLAIQIAFGLVEEFEDGVHFVSLASITDPALVAPVIAQTLGVNQVREGTFAQRLKEYLCDKHALLVLDNFEQVVNAAPFIAELLAACPWLSLIVTSRTPLSIRAERQYPVAPLELPVESNEQVDPVELLCYPAVELFVDRARSIMPDFTPDLENARMVAAICRRLDGLPLAIELASARTNFMSLETLLEQLQNRQMLHANSLRDVSERHHTLYNAIDWSYKLLSAEEQLLLGRLSVFINGWTMSAAETLMNDQPIAASECLRALVNNHLVIQHERRGAIRFLLLETIREYAMERLAESGEEAHMRQRHAEYYLSLAEEADPHLRTAGQLAWLERLEEERGDFHAALTWFVDICGDIEKGMRLAGALGWFWNLRSYVSEGLGWLERILPLAKKVPSAARVRALYAAGSLAWEQGDLSKALAYLEESIALSRELGPDHTWDLALALGNYGNVVMYLGDQETLQGVTEESHALFSQLEDLWGMALTLCLIGETHLLKHDYQRARSCFEESTASLRKTGDQWAIGVSLMDWGYTESLLGNMTSARAHLEESIAVHRSIGERFVRSLSLNILAQVVQQQDDAQLAIAYYGESLDLLRKMGIESSIADVQYNLACFVHAQGHYQFAKKLYGECLEIFSKQENEAGIAKCRAGLDAISDGQNRIPS
jgi:predicted ATPase/transcriptional regulator with XRE-family HTH domain